MPDGAAPAGSGGPDWSGLPPPLPGLQVCVVVPVRNEAGNLRATLQALAGQRGFDGQPLPAQTFEVLLLLNNCTDDSAAVAQQLAHEHPALPLHTAAVDFAPPKAHVGQARACLMAAASSRLRAAACGAQGIIASTDGDSRVDVHWVAATLLEFEQGADVVGGRITSQAADGETPGLRRLVRRDDLVRLWRARLESLIDPELGDPWPRHYQHFGASLALRVWAHDAVGGSPRVPFLEDEALVRLLKARDLGVRHSPRVRVLTSGRREGRVQVGLSQQLSEWAELVRQQRGPCVPDPAEDARVMCWRARLGRLWRARAAACAQPAHLALQARDNAVTHPPVEAALAGLSAQLVVPAQVLQAAWAREGFFGEFWGAVLQAGGAAERRRTVLVDQRQAVAALKALVDEAHQPGRLCSRLMR